MTRPVVAVFLIVGAMMMSCGGNGNQSGKTVRAVLSEQAKLEIVAESERRWTGLAVSAKDRIFVTYPRWAVETPVSVAELSYSGFPVPYPDDSWNNWREEETDPAERFVCVQSLYVDDQDRLWILDPANPRFQGVVSGGAKLLMVNLQTDTVERVYRFDDSVALENSYLNDVRVDTDRNFAYMTDSGQGGIVVLNLETGASYRRLNKHRSVLAEDITVMIEGTVMNGPIHSDGIALSPDGDYLYYQALTGKTLYRVPTKVLRDQSLNKETMGQSVERVGESGVSDGIIFGPDNWIYLTSLELNAIRRIDPDSGEVQVVVQDDRLKWPDSFAVGPRGMIYVSTSQIHLRSDITDPFRIFRFLALSPRTAVLR